MNNNRGQVLLIMVMLIATALTVVLSVSFKSNIETQTTKLEEESQKALAAAEAGIEAGLRQSTSATPYNIQTIAPNLTGFQGNVTVSDDYDKSTFISPLLQKDEQYAFYLADYPGLADASSYTGDLTIYFASESVGSCNSPRTKPALELTLIYSTNQIKKWAVEPCASGNYISGSGLTSATQQSPAAQIDPTDPSTFNYESNDTILASSFTPMKILFIRSLFAPTKIGVSGTINPLKTQGKTVTSDVKSTAGIAKKVQLFQSYPQVPAEFFVITF